MPPKNPSPPSIEDITGKLVLIGITRVDQNEEIVSQEQFAGIFRSMDSMIHVELLNTGKDFTLPPHLGSFLKAKPGVYRLRSSGESIENPAYTSSWTVRPPADRKNPSRKKKP